MHEGIWTRFSPKQTHKDKLIHSIHCVASWTVTYLKQTSRLDFFTSGAQITFYSEVFVFRFYLLSIKVILPQSKVSKVQNEIIVVIYFGRICLFVCLISFVSGTPYDFSMGNTWMAICHFNFTEGVFMISWPQHMVHSLWKQINNSAISYKRVSINSCTALFLI